MTDDELTPVVLIEGKVIGWGWILVRRFKEEDGSQGFPLEEEKETREEVGARNTCASLPPKTVLGR